MTACSLTSNRPGKGETRSAGGQGRSSCDKNAYNLISRCPIKVAGARLSLLPRSRGPGRDGIPRSCWSTTLTWCTLQRRLPFSNSANTSTRAPHTVTVGLLAWSEVASVILFRDSSKALLGRLPFITSNSETLSRRRGGTYRIPTDYAKLAYFANFVVVCATGHLSPRVAWTAPKYPRPCEKVEPTIQPPRMTPCALSRSPMSAMSRPTFRVALRGEALLTNPRFNKGTAFSLRERREFGLDGRLPFKVATLDEQCQRSYDQMNSQESPLHKNSFLQSLKDQNHVLYFALLNKHLRELIPIIYTPTEVRHFLRG
jgi:hypothetical protein